MLRLTSRSQLSRRIHVRGHAKPSMLNQSIVVKSDDTMNSRICSGALGNSGACAVDAWQADALGGEAHEVADGLPGERLARRGRAARAQRPPGGAI